MSSSGEILLRDARSALIQTITMAVGGNDLPEAFASWLLPNQIPGLNAQGAVQLAVSHAGATRTYKDIAILGFAAACNPPDQTHEENLKKSLRWLAGCEPFVDGTPRGFCTDAISLLGVILGVKHTNDPIIKKVIGEWLGKFLDKSYYMRNVSDWQKCLFATIQREAELVLNLELPQTPETADVRVAFRAKGLLQNTQTQAEVIEDEKNALALLKNDLKISLDVARAAVRLTTLDWLYRAMPILVPGSQITLQQVVDLLQRTSGALRLWTWESKPRTSRQEALARKWHIDNEYHVQNLLWTMLAPVFPDVISEEYTPSVGQKHPRADVCIPSLSLIVEAKFMRSTVSPQNMIEEIAADASLYLTASSAYRHIIAFIWDDSRRTEQYELMLRGFRQLRGVFDAIIIPRPSFMIESVEPQAQIRANASPNTDNSTAN